LRISFGVITHDIQVARSTAHDLAGAVPVVRRRAARITQDVAARTAHRNGRMARRQRNPHQTIRFSGVLPDFR